MLVAPPAPIDEPGSPEHPPVFELPPGSPAESDESSELSDEQEQLDETGRIWTRLAAQGEKISQMADRLEMIIVEVIAELRVDMAAVVGKTTSLRSGMVELHEQMDSLQRGFVTASEADRKQWMRNSELEREVADLKRDRDS